MIKTLFGLDKKDGMKVWTIGTALKFDDQPNGPAYLTVIHGQLDGKMQTKTTEIGVGKQGRNPFQQAVSEAEGKIKKQIDKGYRENKQDLAELPLLAMLAADYRKQGHRISYPCLTSVKYDGVRCLAKCTASGITLESRTGQPYDVPHIVAELALVMQPGDVLDGELYLHGEILQDITSAVKRTDTQAEIDKCERKVQKTAGKGEENAEAISEYNEAVHIARIRPLLEFHVFDIPSHKVFEARFADLVAYAERFDPAGKVKVTQYATAISDEAMKDLHKEAVSLGYEGIMLRNLNGLYESGKRSADLQKFKTMLDEEFQIDDVVEDKDGNGVIVCKNNINDLKFTVVMGNHADRIYQLTHKHLFRGEWLTVAFQARYKKTLLPQFPCGKCLREGRVIDGEFVPSV